MDKRSTPHFWLSLAAFFLSCSLFAQNATIEGNVWLDDESAPVTNVFLYLDNTGISTISNSRGEFRLTGIPAGSYQLVASCMGYSTIQESVEIVEGESIRLSLHLQELAV